MAFDEEHDDGLGGRSRARREVTESWRWGRELILLPAWHVDALEADDKLKKAIHECRNITSPIALKRQIGHIDSLIRDLDDDMREALRKGIDTTPFGKDPDSVTTKWVTRLRADGDKAIDAFVTEFPTADRQQVRQTVRGGKEGSITRLVREIVTSGRSE